MTEMTGMTKLEKLEWVHWVFDELLQGYKIPDSDLETAIGFVEDIREDYMDDLK